MNASIAGLRSFLNRSARLLQGEAIASSRSAAALGDIKVGTHAELEPESAAVGDIFPVADI